MSSVFYIIMRNDLDSLNPGKAMAQACHAGTQFVSYLHQKFPKKIDEYFGYDGIMTTIVLEGNREQMTALHNLYLENIKQDPYYSDDILDETYPFSFSTELLPYMNTEKFSELTIKDNTVYTTREELTCSWYFIKEENVEKFKELTKKVKLELAK